MTTFNEQEQYKATLMFIKGRQNKISEAEDAVRKIKFLLEEAEKKAAYAHRFWHGPESAAWACNKNNMSPLDFLRVVEEHKLVVDEFFIDNMKAAQEKLEKANENNAALKEIHAQLLLEQSMPPTIYSDVARGSILTRAEAEDVLFRMKEAGFGPDLEKVGGVYCIKDGSKVLYVGESQDIYSRMFGHMQSAYGIFKQHHKFSYASREPLYFAIAEAMEKKTLKLEVLGRGLKLKKDRLAVELEACIAHGQEGIYNKDKFKKAPRWTTILTHPAYEAWKAEHTKNPPPTHML